MVTAYSLQGLTGWAGCLRQGPKDFEAYPRYMPPWLCLCEKCGTIIFSIIEALAVLLGPLACTLTEATGASL